MEIKFLNVSLKENNKYLIKNLNLQIKSNQITGIYGDNNQVISKLLTKDLNYHGTIKIDSNLFQVYEKNLISYIDKLNINTFLTKNVRDEFYLVKRKLNNNEKSYIKKVIASLNMVGLSESYLEKEIKDLSKSEKRLVQIALNLITNPDIIIIEEPFLYLSKEAKNNIKKVLLDLKKRYLKTIIIISDDINILYELTNYLIIFKDNKILISDSTNTVLKDLNLLESNKIELPDLILFNKIALNYGKKLTNHKDIKDLIKEVYRNAQETKKET